VPTGDIIAVITRLLDGWQAHKAALDGSGDGFTFRDFCDGRSDEELQAIAAGQAVNGVPDRGATEAVTVRVPGTLLDLSDGTDEITLEVENVRQALDQLARLHPKLTAYLVNAPGEVNAAVNLYIGEDDIRGLGGFDATLEPGDELSILPAMAGG
jgi:ferredoxin-nitrite reductase